VNFLSAKIFIIKELDRLSPALTYHGKHHTLDVFAVAERLCAAEKVSEKETIIVLTAALLHDIGFLRHYTDHEEHGCRIAEEWLPKFGYTEGSIKEIRGLIGATKIPQSPKTPLEEILCDADLDYLGRDDFYSIGTTLFQEMKTLKMVETEAEWHAMQVSFLQNHHYFTATSRKERTPIQEKHLAELIKSNQTNP
jgi:uncharacterized protein